VTHNKGFSDGHTAKLRPVCLCSSLTPPGEPGADFRDYATVKKTGCAAVGQLAYRHSHSKTIDCSRGSTIAARGCVSVDRLSTVRR